jgi:hypothetical protein
MFINGGSSSGFAQQTKAYKLVETKFYTYSDTKYLSLFDDPRTYEQGFFLGIGINYKRLLVETRIEKGDGISDLMDLGSHTIRYYLFLGYQL